MKQLFPQVGVARLCGLFGKSRQAMYDTEWRKTDELMGEEIIVAMVKGVRKDLPRLGAAKLYNLLKGKITEHGIKIGRDAFFKLLRNNELLVKRKRKYVITTESKHHFRKWPNLIDNLTINQAEELWVSDITYIRTKNSFVYLFLITDAYSRKIVGYHLSQELKVKGCVIALNKALKNRQYSDRELIHHSDRGIQYCCDQYVSLLLENQIQISMTQSGSPYDNAIAERINGILKNELGMDQTFKNYSDAIGPLSRSIHVYNNLRPHMSCNNLTPEQAHRAKGKLNKKWKKRKHDVNRQFLRQQ